MTGAPPTEDDPRVAVEADLRRVADRLRGAPVRKVEEATERIRAVLQRLADTAHAVETRGDGSAPGPRPVPALPLAALGDQTAVLGADLLAAIDGVPDATVIGSATLGDTLADLAAALKALRLSL